MAHIFKKYNPQNGAKGVFVITHKEIEAFKGFPMEWKEKYYAGIYYGSSTYVNGAIKQPYQDFCLGTETIVPFIGEQPFRIPLTSRAFTPRYFFEDKKVNKHWDIINISRNSKIKQLDYFLDAIRKVYDRGYDYKVLLVCPACHNEKPETHFVDIVEKYEQMFSRKERENFTLMRISKELGFLGISISTIAYLTQSSKVGCLLSKAEGEPRVIHEALLCGLPFVCYEALQGAGRDYLDSTNSVQFSNYDEIDLALIEAVERAGKDLVVDTESMANELSETRTLPLLESYFKTMFENNGDAYIPGLINVDEMNLRLPAHYLDLPWAEGGNGVTADILTRAQREIFFNELS